MELLVADCRCRAEPQGRRASLVNPMLKLDGLPNVRLMSALSGHSDRFIHFSTVFWKKRREEFSTFPVWITRHSDQLIIDRIVKLIQERRPYDMTEVAPSFAAIMICLLHFSLKWQKKGLCECVTWLLWYGQLLQFSIPSHANRNEVSFLFHPGLISQHPFTPLKSDLGHHHLSILVAVRITMASPSPHCIFLLLYALFTYYKTTRTREWINDLKSKISN